MGSVLADGDVWGGACAGKIVGQWWSGVTSVDEMVDVVWV